MAAGMKGEMKIQGMKAKCEGPHGPKDMGKSYDTSKGPLGMRQTYKQTGKPGGGSK